MAKKEKEKLVCPQCGSMSFLTTRKGPLCNVCKFLIDEKFFMSSGAKTKLGE
jgi:ribosomal protein L37E